MLWNNKQHRSNRIDIIWVQAHSNIEGNEKAYELVQPNRTRTNITHYLSRNKRNSELVHFYIYDAIIRITKVTKRLIRTLRNSLLTFTTCLNRFLVYFLYFAKKDTNCKVIFHWYDLNYNHFQFYLKFYHSILPRKFIQPISNCLYYIHFFLDYSQHQQIVSADVTFSFTSTPLFHSRVCMHIHSTNIVEYSMIKMSTLQQDWKMFV